MKIVHLQAKGVKGKDFEHDIHPVTVWLGRNGAGKSARLLAIELALRGAKPSDRRAGLGDKRSVTARLQGVPGVDGGELFIYRTVAPKAELSVSPWGKLTGKDGQARLDGVLGVPPAVFDIAEFVGMTDDKKRARLLELSAHVPVDAYAGICPQVQPISGESAASWLRRALEAMREERLALQAAARRADTTTVTLTDATRGQFVSTDALRQELATIQDQIKMASDAAAAAGAVTDLQQALAEREHSLAQLGTPASDVDVQADTAAERAAFGKLEELRRQQSTWEKANGFREGALRRKMDAQSQLDGLAKSTLPGRASLCWLQAALLTGDAPQALQALAHLQAVLHGHGYPATLATQKRLDEATAELASLESGMPARVSAEQLVAANRSHQEAMQRLAQRRADADAAKRSGQERERLTKAIAQFQVDLPRVRERASILSDKALPPERVSELQARVQTLQAAIEEAVRSQAVRDTEARLAAGAAKDRERAVEVKRIEAELKSALDEVLRKAIAPIADVVDPFCSLFGARFALGEDAPLGFARDGTWIPLEAGSESEQAVFGAGLALALGQRDPGKGLRLVMLDGLDCCDDDRAPEVLRLGAKLVTQGRMDMLLCTTTRGFGLPDIDDGVSILEV